MTTAAQPAAPVATASPPPPFPDPVALAEAHARLRADKAIQFDFPWVTRESNPPPKWLTDLFEAIGWALQQLGATGWHTVFYVIVALIAIALLVAFVPPLRAWVMRMVRRGRAAEAEAPRWVPEAAVARRLLDEADGLAAHGRYDEAVRLILARSIEDIERWREGLVRPSHTSRDIARAPDLPDTARAVFARIADLVERSLFGGRALARADWDAARADYAGFALGAR